MELLKQMLRKSESRHLIRKFPSQILASNKMYNKHMHVLSGETTAERQLLLFRACASYLQKRERSHNSHRYSHPTPSKAFRSV